MSAHLLNETALRALKRPEIQKLAKREKIKATSKTDTIIGELLAKFPSGVSPLEKETATARKSRRIADVQKIKEEVAEQEQRLFPTSQAIQGSSAPVEQPVLVPQLEQDGLTTGHPASAAAQAPVSPRTLNGAPGQQHLEKWGHKKALMGATQSRMAQRAVQEAAQGPSKPRAQSDATPTDENRQKSAPGPALRPAPPRAVSPSIPPSPASRTHRAPVRAPQPQPEAGPSRIPQPVSERASTRASIYMGPTEGDIVAVPTAYRAPAVPARVPQPPPEAGPSGMRRAVFQRAPTPARTHDDDAEGGNGPLHGPARQHAAPTVRPRPEHPSRRIAFAERPAGAHRRIDTLAPSTPPSVHSRTPHRVPTPIPQSSPEPALSSAHALSPTRPNVWDTPPETGATSDGADEELAALEKKARLNEQLDPNRPIVGCSMQGLKRVRRGIEEMMGRVIHVEALDKTMRGIEDRREALPEELEELKHRELKLIAGRMVLEQVLRDLKNKETGWLNGKWQASTEWHQERMRKAAAVRERQRQRKEKKEGKKRERAQVVESRVNNQWKLKVKRQHGLDMSPPQSPPPIPQLHSPFRFDPTWRPRHAPARFFPPRAPMQQTAAMPPRGVPQAHRCQPATHRGQQSRSQMLPPPIPRQPAPRVLPVPLQDHRQPVPEEDDVPTPSPPNGRVLPASFHPSGTTNYSRSRASQQPETGPSRAHAAEPQPVSQQGTQASAHLGQPLAPLGGHSAALVQYYASLHSASTGLRGMAEHSSHAHAHRQAGPSVGYAQSPAGPSMDYSIGAKRRHVEEEDLEYEDAVSYAEDEPGYEEDAVSYAGDELSYEEDENEHQSQTAAVKGEQGGYRPRPVPGYNGHREASPESRWGPVSNWAPAPYKRSRYE